MRFEIQEENVAVAHLKRGDVVVFRDDFNRDSVVPCPFPPPYLTQALIPRLLRGRLLMSWVDGEDTDQVKLSGHLEHRKFHCLTVRKDQAYCISLTQLASFHLGEGASLKAAFRWFDPVCWFVGVNRMILVSGPAELLFYGEGVRQSQVTSKNADLLVAFDASNPVTIRAGDPRKKFWAHVRNALSAEVFVNFPVATTVLERTVPTARKRRAFAIAKLLFGIALSAFATWILLGKPSP